jgi:hypothetical protein
VGSRETTSRNLTSFGGGILPNPANHGGMVTLAGDLGTAANTFMNKGGTDAWDALMDENHSDMRGDVDGLNLSAILGKNGWTGATPVASAMIGYYLGSGPETATNRAQLFMDTSPYVVKSEDLGQHVISPSLGTDISNVAAYFSLTGGKWFSGVEGTGPVVQAFGQWLYQEQQGLNPLTDVVR